MCGLPFGVALCRIDWDMEGDIADDPFYRLVFPTMAMLSPEHQELLNKAEESGDPFTLKDTVDEIRESLNPHPAGQKELNANKKGMEDLTGVQHKYAETVLFFPAAAQTCHAYCTYCFRWAQFIGDTDLRFAQKDAGSLFDYLADHPEVRACACMSPAPNGGGGQKAAAAKKKAVVVPAARVAAASGGGAVVAVMMVAAARASERTQDVCARRGGAIRCQAGGVGCPRPVGC